MKTITLDDTKTVLATGGTGGSDELRWFAHPGQTMTIGLNGELWSGKVSRLPDGTLCLDEAVKIGGYGEARVVRE
jgi:hypothetical protein